MKNITKIITLCLVLLVTSCVPSLNPLYTDEDLIFDNTLIGVWAEKDTRETWAISSCDGKQEYTLLHTDENGKKGEFSARLVKVGDRTFFDIIPIKPGFKQGDFYQGHFLPTHTFAQVSKDGSSIRLSVLEPQWLKEVVLIDPNAIRHQKVNGEIILTSSPKETQKFLLANMNNREAFSAPMQLTRKGSEKY